MIQLSTLAKAIEDSLNANDKGIVYVIHTDMGTYETALKTRTNKRQYTNGVLDVLSSAIVPAQGLVVATQQARLEICVQLPDPARDEEIVAAHRAILDGVFANVTVDSITDTDGKTYTVSATYSLADSGSAQMRPMAGTSYTFIVNIEYSFIEGGLNSLNCIFTLDGVRIPYTSATITRRPTTEANVYSDGAGQARCVNTASAISVDLQLPARSATDGLSEVLLAQILTGDLNAVHVLTVQFGGITHTYIMIFGETNVVVNGVANAGHTISLIEAASFLEGEDG